MNQKLLQISEIIDSNIAVTSSDAKKLFDEIKKNIENNDVSILDFDGISTLTTAFLNESIGTLYNVADSNKLKKLVKINPSTILPIQVKKISEVISNAKEKNRIDE